MKTPKQLIVEYEDNSAKTIPFTQLDRPIWRELSRRGFCSPPPEWIEPAKSYLLLRWKNGWQEVVALDQSDQDSVDLLRYYILERVEETGRVVLETGVDYPLLFTLKRLPKEIESLSIVGAKSAKVYDMEPKKKKEEGDKIEHVEFDRAERHFGPRAKETGEDGVEEMPRLLAVEIKKKGLSPKRLLNLEPGQKVAEYKELAKSMGIRAMEKQEDLYGFLQLMVGKLTASEK
jgi:hypothetical protein